MSTEIVEVLRSVLKEELAPINERLGRIETDVTGLKITVADLTMDVTGLKNAVADLTTDVTGLKNAVADLRTDVNELKTDVTGLKTNMSRLEQEMIIIKSEQQKTSFKMEKFETRQEKIYEQTGQLLEFQSEAISRFNQLATKEDLEYLNSKILLHDRELFNLKKRA